MKKLHHENWLLADAEGGLAGEARKWRETFLAIALDPAIPAAVALMFESARGGMLYGYFFQPLLALGVEQCYRCMERGARERAAAAGLETQCQDSQGRSHPLSFAHNLRALGKLGVIDEADLLLWKQAREMREWVAAPEHHAALTLDHAATALARASELLGRLFREGGRSPV